MHNMQDRMKNKKYLMEKIDTLNTHIHETLTFLAWYYINEPVLMKYDVVVQVFKMPTLTHNRRGYI